MMQQKSTQNTSCPEELTTQLKISGEVTSKFVASQTHNAMLIKRSQYTAKLAFRKALAAKQY